MRYWVILCLLFLDARFLAWHCLAEMPIDPQIPPNARRVEFLAFPDVQLLDVTGPLQVLASANRLAEDAGQPPPYALKVVSAVPGPIVSSAGLALLAEPLPPPDQPLDTLIVAGGVGVHVARTDPGLVDWVTRRAASARRITSVCTGAFLLASTGLLDGHRATTHWSRCAELAAAFPAVRVEKDPIYVNDGNVWTSAGVTAGIDMALALLEADHGRAVANAVARQLVVFAKRPGGQAQFSAGLALSGSDGTFDSLHGWMRRNLRGNLTVPALAEQAGMSERSFLRHYRQVTGATPARAVERVRVEAARQALGETSLPVKRIARDCGFGSEETMRRSFLRVLAVPPHAYRERFPV
ncbi:MAG: GlxA family transcriptional regulator [Rhodopila sp.]|nr:GlxA family transcriptional regulator [Rhodopila sp.]